jgi:outer membrane receptor for Fe3+-dicitrate
MRYNNRWLRNYYMPQTTTEATRLYEEMPSTVLWRGFVRYQWKTQKTTQSVSLNANNIFDKLYVGTNSSSRSMGRQLTLQYRIVYR